jgi:gag-polypeptide of LTR copia-type
MTDDSESLFDLYYPFQKLNFRNWSVWSVKMEAALRCHGVWAVVATIDPDKLDADLAADEALQRKDNTARLAILLMVSRQVFSIVAGTKTAHEAWAKLRAAFQLTGFWHRTGLTRQLYSIKQQPRESNIVYIARAADLRNQLEAAGCSEGQMEGFAAAALSGLRLDLDSHVGAL